MVDCSVPSICEASLPVTRLMMFWIDGAPENVAVRPDGMLKLVKLWKRLAPAWLPAVIWKLPPEGVTSVLVVPSRTIGCPSAECDSAQAASSAARLRNRLEVGRIQRRVPRQRGEEHAGRTAAAGRVVVQVAAVGVVKDVRAGDDRAGRCDVGRGEELRTERPPRRADFEERGVEHELVGEVREIRDRIGGGVG